MELIQKLKDPSVWDAFYAYKEATGNIHKKTLQELKTLIVTEQYRPVVENIESGIGFGAPRKSEISRTQTEKKRIVYTYCELENWVLKLLTWLLQRKYDGIFAECLYSFRPNKGVREAVKRLTATKNIWNMWSYKVDIHNYFNDIPVDKLLPLLEGILKDVPQTYAFCRDLLLNPLVNDHGTLIQEKKGIMAGTPLSAFLANVYLMEMDIHFQNAGICYIRYADDIIVFDETEQKVNNHAETIHTFLHRYGLQINPKKQALVSPGRAWTFLGFTYEQGRVDIAEVSAGKLKAKLRRKVRALKRWQARKGTSGENAAKAFVRVVNKKLYQNSATHEITWTRWYFPIINTDRTLKILDRYIQDNIRYLVTGTRTKSAYNVRYEDIKQLGYVSLVHEYYALKKEKDHPVR